MKQEVIQNFLNLPGIAGVALMDGRSRPYFCGVDQTLNFQQKEALAQGILQVVETIPDGFESFEFQFTGHQVYIYKLEHGIILLVLTQADLVYADYLQTIKQLKAALQEDISNAIATFRLIAGNITLSGQSYRKPKPESASTKTLSSNPHPSEPSATKNPPPPPPFTAKDLGATTHTSNGLKNPVVPPSNPDQTSLKDLLAGLNHLSQFTTQYLGTAVIVNYWKSSQPQGDWLSNFQVDRSAQISFTSSSQNINQPISPEQHQQIRDWVLAFIKRCSQVIRDFPAIVEQKALNEQQKALLLG